MIRKTRKIRKLRGSRTIGGGSSKKRRGAGHRGGRGMAGGHKHMWSWIVKYDPNHYGKYGFKRPQKTIYNFKPVNLAFLDEKLDDLVVQGLATKEKGKIVLDVTQLGYNKVLGKGKINKPVIIKSPKFSESAVRKIEEAGGKAETI
ncbi:MAG: 50S ribosomal protein L15 [Methanobacterium sp.]|jgi:large subunit ribosomal protein L15|nr:50S ribosomal protein L15 [Methanobacterium sp.]